MANKPTFDYRKPIVYDIKEVPEFNCSRYARKVAYDFFNKYYVRGPGNNGGDAWVVDDHNKRVWIEGSSVNYSTVVELGMIVIMTNPSTHFGEFLLDKQGKRIKGKGTHMGVIVKIDRGKIYIWNQYISDVFVNTIRELEFRGLNVVQVIDAPSKKKQQTNKPIINK